MNTTVLLRVAKLYGHAAANTAKRWRLHLPVLDGITEKTDAVIWSLLHAEGLRAEVIHIHAADVVRVQVDHLVEHRNIHWSK